MRLDVYLKEQLGTRNRAQDAIDQGRVLVNGKPVKKASTQITPDDEIRIQETDHDFVSRSGGKLQAALDQWKIPLNDQVVLDIGASTGGFTQCVLEHGARKVYALDVGHLQLSEALAKDPRVINMEKTNAREIQTDWFDEPIDFVCMDVSFISAKTILEPLFEQLTPSAMVILVKPQFEAGKEHVRGGVVRQESVRKKILDDMVHYLEQKYVKVYAMPSPVLGRKGNQEYLVYAFRPRSSAPDPAAQIQQ